MHITFPSEILFYLVGRKKFDKKNSANFFFLFFYDESYSAGKLK